jgi:rare lipoprotein A
MTLHISDLSGPALRTVLRVGGLVAVSVLLANCAQQRTASGPRSKEIGAFSHAKYGAASPRVVADGQAVPKGGGREHVGRPYSIAGRRYVPYVKPTGFTQVGQASWYGEAFHGRKTANGEIYDRHGVSAAHTTMPLPSYARVTNTLNGRSIIVRVNDRGPYHGNRVIDLSQATADALAFRHLGTARVRVDYVGRASLGGSDDRKLLASLRTDGQPASLPGYSEPTMIATQPAEPVSPRPVSAPVAPRPAPVAAEPLTVASAMAPAPVQAAAVTAVPMSEPGPARAVAAPRPPDRPFDLATIPNAAVPVSRAVPGLVTGQPRQQVAGMFFAPVSDAPQMFSRNHPLAKDVKPQKFVALTR